MDTQIKIPCTLIPYGSIGLLLPNSAIKEVIKTEVIPASGGEARQYLLGHVQWQGQSVPVFALHTTPGASSTERQLVVITEAPDSHDYIAFGATHMPSAVLAGQQSVTEDSRPDGINPIALSYVIVDGQKAVIPDLERCLALLLVNK